MDKADWMSWWVAGPWLRKASMRPLPLWSTTMTLTICWHWMRVSGRSSPAWTGLSRAGGAVRAKGADSMAGWLS